MPRWPQSRRPHSTRSRSRCAASTVVAVVSSIGLSLVVGVGNASAEDPSIEVVRAKALRDGSAVVTLRVSCDPALDVLEANISLSQGDQVNAFSGVSGVACSGRSQRIRVELVPSSGTGGFDEGAAHASAFLLLRDPATGATVQAQDVGEVTLR